MLLLIFCNCTFYKGQRFLAPNLPPIEHDKDLYIYTKIKVFALSKYSIVADTIRGHIDSVKTFSEEPEENVHGEGIENEIHIVFSNINANIKFISSDSIVVPVSEINWIMKYKVNKSKTIRVAALIGSVFILSILGGLFSFYYGAE
jgi:hypothetical protein